MWERGHCTGSVYQPDGLYTQHGNDLTPAQQLSFDSSRFLLSLKLLHLCTIPIGNLENTEIENFSLSCFLVCAAPDKLDNSLGLSFLI